MRLTVLGSTMLLASALFLGACSIVPPPPRLCVRQQHRPHKAVPRIVRLALVHRPDLNAKSGKNW
jgi:hypothetical protein